MVSRIEVVPRIPDSRARSLEQRLISIGFPVSNTHLIDVYLTDANLTQEELEIAASLLSNPVTEQASVNQPQNPEKFDWAIEIGFLPGVTDNVGNTAQETIEDAFGSVFEKGEGIYSSRVIFISGSYSREDVKKIADSLANPLIQSIRIKNYEEFANDDGMGKVVPKVKLNAEPSTDIVDIIDANDDKLVEIGKKGIANEDGSRRGPLALDLTYMKAIQAYFKKKLRNPTDVELESIAQTWSEHCKHTIFADPIDDIAEGLYKRFIKGATERIRKEKGDWVIFPKTLLFLAIGKYAKDNRGNIYFDEKPIPFGFKLE